MFFFLVDWPVIGKADKWWVWRGGGGYRQQFTVTEKQNRTGRHAPTKNSHKYMCPPGYYSDSVFVIL